MLQHAAPGQRSARRQAFLIGLVICLIAVALGVQCVAEVARSESGQDVMWDDAYYYIIVARNLATRGQSSFDGLHATNGYHPLWLWLLAALYYLGGAGLTPAGQALAIVCLQHVILAGTVGLLLLRLSRSRGISPMAQACGLFALMVLVYPWNLDVFLGGMESILVLPCMALFLYFVWTSQWTWAGVAALFLVLSRMDTMVYVLLPVALLVVLRRRGSPRTAAGAISRMGAPAFLGVGLLMLANEVMFGRPVPISGILKSTFPALHVQWSQVTAPLVTSLHRGSLRYFTHIHQVTALVILPACALALLPSGHLDRSWRRKAMLFPILGLIQVASFVFFQKWGKPVPPWYLACLVILTCPALACAAGNVIGRRGLVALSLIGAVCILPLSIFRELYRPAARTFYSRELLEFVKSQPPGSIWASTDCGALPFWSEATFVNLDGLVNGYDYQLALRDGRLRDFLRDSDARYLVDTIYSAGSFDFREPMYLHRESEAAYGGDYEVFEFYLYSYQYGVYSDTIRLHPEQEVFRLAHPAKSPGFASFATVVFDLTATVEENPGFVDRSSPQREGSNPDFGP